MYARLFGCFTLRSPLSHIGESESTHTFLAETQIVQPDGSVEPVFRYSGNAWRGQLRDLMAAYMLERLGSARVPLETFHLLFSGGKIGGDLVTDVGAARRLRAAVPMIALLGGGVGNQILAGKLRVSNCYPVCEEAIPCLPEWLHAEARRSRYGELTAEESFSRRDDAKDPKADRFIADDPARLLGDGQAKPKKKGVGGPPEQMRMTAELLASGARLYSEIDCLDATEVELGCLVSGIAAWSRSPHLGGMANKGMGRVRLRYELLDLDTGEVRDFVRVEDGPALLAPPAVEAKARYDDHLRTLYDEQLAAGAPEIRQLLGAGAA